MASPPSSSSQPQHHAKNPIWSPTQYLKFSSQRAQPLTDLLARIPALPNPESPRIVDLGCGPGNSTAQIRERYPGARIMGVDADGGMVRRAREVFANLSPEDEKGKGKVDFIQGDIETFVESMTKMGEKKYEMGEKKYEKGEKKYEKPDLILSNSTFHWLRRRTRIPTIQRLLKYGVKEGGVVAIQMPDSWWQDSHRVMREVAKQSNKPWSRYFEDVRVGVWVDEERPDFDPVEMAEEWYNGLVGECGGGEEGLQIWRTKYMHFLKGGVGEVVEWVKGSGLRPFLERIADKGVEKEFLEEYRRGLEKEYEVLEGNTVGLGYWRFFFVGVRKGV